MVTRHECDAHVRLAAGDEDDMSVTSTWIAVATLAMIMAAIAWIDARCLADLGNTADRELRYFDRSTWKLIIVLSFPLGPALYVACAKDHGRPW
jgi:hypothetical protein